jgi:hypothetical protein
MAISRADLLKELLPGLNQLFGMEYEKYNRNLLGGNEGIHGIGQVRHAFDGSDATDENPDGAEYTVRYKGIGR